MLLTVHMYVLVTLFDTQTTRKSDDWDTIKKYFYYLYGMVRYGTVQYSYFQIENEEKKNNGYN